MAKWMKAKCVTLETISSATHVWRQIQKVRQTLQSSWAGSTHTAPDTRPVVIAVAALSKKHALLQYAPDSSVRTSWVAKPPKDVFEIGIEKLQTVEASGTLTKFHKRRSKIRTRAEAYMTFHESVPEDDDDDEVNEEATGLDRAVFFNTGCGSADGIDVERGYPDEE